MNTNLHLFQKRQIVALVESEKNRMGSYNKVATKCGASSATISTMRSNPDNPLISDDMWIQVGVSLGWNTSTWKIIETRPLKAVRQILKDSKTDCLFKIIVSRAGTGKTVGIDSFEKEYSGVIVVRCRKWGVREFLQNLAKTCGINLGKGFKSTAEMEDAIIEYFQLKKTHQPILVVDQANWLKPSMLAFFISLYNACEDECGCVLAGNESMEKWIQRGLKYSVIGMDEFFSRFARRFNHLPGVVRGELKQICHANGLTDDATIGNIWQELQPEEHEEIVNGRPVLMKQVTDLRRLKNIVRREKLLTTTNLN